MQTIVPTDAEGNLDLGFSGVKVTLETPTPPQSAVPFIVSMSTEQHQRLDQFRFKKGSQQDICKRIYDKTKKDGDKIIALVLSTDMKAIKRGH